MVILPFRQLKKRKKTVYAVDIEPKMFNFLKERADTEKIKNIKYVVSDLEKIDLDENSVDKAIVAFVLHEVSSLGQALNEFKRMLSPGGMLLVLEWEAVETEIGPPLHERISSEKMKEIFNQNGLHPELLHINEAIYALKIMNK
jgi:ubiquinone/menaquinone biosynthesis C-methylase UbiE